MYFAPYFLLNRFHINIYIFIYDMCMHIEKIQKLHEVRACSATWQQLVKGQAWTGQVLET